MCLCFNMMMMPDVIFVLLYFLVHDNECVCYNKCMCLNTRLHHLPLGSVWPSPSEYGGCTHYVFSKYMCYSLHSPPSDNKNKN